MTAERLEEIRETTTGGTFLEEKNDLLAEVNLLRDHLDQTAEGERAALVTARELQRDRRGTAIELGLTYATLRVYERALGDLLQVRQGKNRTIYYSASAVRLLASAIRAKRRGIPYSLLREYFLGLLVPPPCAMT
jgi:hypothetical protein